MTEAATTVIDEGIRKWYASCRCCLSDAHPDIVATLDAERDAHHEPHADAGICEAAEAQPSGSNAEVATMAKILDPVCDMIVDVDEQRGKGLTSDLDGKTYAFCGPGCKKTFDKDPGRFAAKVDQWQSAQPPA